MTTAATVSHIAFILPSAAFFNSIASAGGEELQ
jgi:hypothetical protein